MSQRVTHALCCDVGADPGFLDPGFDGRPRIFGVTDEKHSIKERLTSLAHSSEVTEQMFEVSFDEISKRKESGEDRKAMGNRIKHLDARTELLDKLKSLGKLEDAIETALDEVSP